MYTFEEKNRIIIQTASAEHFEKDKALFFKHCSNPKLERDIQRANAFTYAKVDGQILSELLNKLTLEEILANRVGEVKSPSKKKQSTSSKKGSGSKGSKRPRENKSKSENKTVAPVESDKKKEPNEKSSPE